MNSGYNYSRGIALDMPSEIKSMETFEQSDKT